MMANTAIKKAMAILGSAPVPSQTTNKGARATFGTLLKPMISGYRKRSNMREPTRAMAINTPPMTDSTKPASVVQRVYSEWLRYQGRRSEEHTSELQSLKSNSYDVCSLQKNTTNISTQIT